MLRHIMIDVTAPPQHADITDIVAITPRCHFRQLFVFTLILMMAIMIDFATLFATYATYYGYAATLPLPISCRFINIFAIDC